MKALTRLPLFAREKRRDIATLVVRRFDGERWVRASKQFTVDELPDREAVRERFGGGSYELIGRDKNRIVARSRFVVDGPPLPLESEAIASPSLDKRDARAFAMPGGAREALVFRLLDEGRSLVEITTATHIETHVVRTIHIQWITPLGWDPPKTPEEIGAYAAARRAVVATQQEASWLQQWSEP